MPPEGSTVLFQRAPRSIQRAGLKQFANDLSAQVAGGRSFQCLITNDAELARLNQEFLGKRYATDVLSFPSIEGSAGLGDIAISADRAIAQAEEFGHSPDQEIRILMLHGVLHLIGLDHETDRGEMRGVEKSWRTRFGLPPGLIERVSR